MDRYDIIIVGAGTAGSVAAWSAAKKGARVLLLESKTPNKIGRKVCGDAIGAGHFDVSGVPRPPKEIILDNVDAIVVYPPSGQHGFQVEGEGYMLDRMEWGRWLVRLALDAGVELKHSTKVTRPILENGRVVGLKATQVESGEQTTFEGKIVIDASGWTGVIRRNLPAEEGVEHMPLRRDVSVCYREVRNLKRPIEHPEIAQVYLDQEIAPGGYWWFFPHGADQVNIGLGLQGGRGLDPKHLFVKHLARLDVLIGSEVLDEGGGVVPTRRSLHSLTGFGAMFVGDAAFTVNPISGGGIGPSMQSGSLAGRIALEALGRTDSIDEVMWSLNQEYVKTYGMKAAGLDIFRLLLLSLSNEDIEFGMQKQLITEEDLHRVSYGQDDLPIREKTLRIIRGIRRPTVLKHLATTSSYMKMVKQMYLDYPSIDKFQPWSYQVNSIFSQFQKRLTS